MTIISTTPILTDYWEADRRIASAIREVLSDNWVWDNYSEFLWEELVLPDGEFYTTSANNGNPDNAKDILTVLTRDLELVGYIGYTQNGFYYIEKVDNDIS